MGVSIIFSTPSTYIMYLYLFLIISPFIYIYLYTALSSPLYLFILEDFVYQRIYPVKK